MLTSLRRLPLWAALILSTLGLLAHTATAKADGYPVTLSAPASVHPGDAIPLTATTTTNVGPTPYFIVIVDDDTGSPIAQCGSGASCSATVFASWTSSAARHFHAAVGTYTDSRTVSIVADTWNVSLAGDKLDVQVPGTYTLTATSDRTVDGTPYFIKIVSDDTGQAVASCGGGTTCVAAFAPGWDHNDDGVALHYHAEIAPESGSAVEQSGAIAINFVPYYFQVQVSRGAVTGSDGYGHALGNITATVNRDVANTPYFIFILGPDGTQVERCGGGLTCVAFNARLDLSYKAVVARSDRTNVIGTSDAPYDLDVSQVATMLAASPDPCLIVAQIPEQSRISSSAGDLFPACERWVQANMTPQQLALGLAKALPAAAFAYLTVFASAVQDGRVPSSPAPPTTYPPTSTPIPVEAPTTLPGAWSQPLQRVVTAIHAADVDHALTDTAVEEVARQCLWQEARALSGLDMCGESEVPIWITGTDVPEASQHDLDAIRAHPEWFRLNYRKGALNPKSRSWKSGRAVCVQANVDGKDCDEFPYYASEQNQPDSLLEPDLAGIDRTQNRRQGSHYYWRLLAPCGMRSGPADTFGQGALFLVVPIPEAPIDMPSRGICMGKPQGIGTDDLPPEYAPTLADDATL